MSEYAKPWPVGKEGVPCAASLVARAFRLPERWQTVLWHSEVEQRSLAEIGEGLGLRPNAVAALAYRAREGLRQAYLQAHLTGDSDENCRPTIQRLGGWTRGKLSPGDAALVAEHLAGCDRCHGLAAELADVNGGIRGLLAPLAVAGPAAGYTSFASVGVAASGAVLGTAAMPSAAATGASSVLGSALGWLLGAQGGQVAAAVLTAVVVGGTAVATGATGTGPGERGPTTAAVAAASSDGTGSARARIQSVRLIPQQSVAANEDKPSASKRPNGKPSDGKPSNGKVSNGKPSREPAAEESSRGGASLSQVTSASSAPSVDKSARAKVKGKPTSAKATHAESSMVPSAQGGGPGRVGRSKNPTTAVGATSRSAGAQRSRSARAETGARAAAHPPERRIHVPHLDSSSSPQSAGRLIVNRPQA